VSDQAKFAALKAIYPQAVLESEGGKPVGILPDMKFQAGNATQQMTLLLVPFEHSGYATRLFFERALKGFGSSDNWKEHTLLNRKWWAPSWANVSANLTWGSMLCAHLRAVA
jgi:hypothetical protein